MSAPQDARCQCDSCWGEPSQPLTRSTPTRLVSKSARSGARWHGTRCPPHHTPNQETEGNQPCDCRDDLGLLQAPQHHHLLAIEGQAETNDPIADGSRQKGESWPAAANDRGRATVWRE